ncbi:MAG: hypothetical protein F6K55_09395 [Moorea sp. SIO4A3]|nr:hypothetical protein [Moorena producens]NEO44327.1 hypothetical protein [Moorena sp. SIO4A3]
MTTQPYKSGLDITAQIYSNFFSNNPLRKMTRTEVANLLDVCRQTIYDWQTQVIDPAPHEHAVIISGEFYSKNNKRPRKRLRGLSVHQVFIFWLISQIMLVVTTYDAAIPLLGRMLEMFPKEDFDVQLSKYLKRHRHY